MSFSTVTIISICVFCLGKFRYSLKYHLSEKSFLVLTQFDLSHAKVIARNSQSSSGGLLFREKRSPRQVNKLLLFKTILRKLPPT